MHIIYCNSDFSSYESLDSSEIVDSSKLIELVFFDTILMNDFMSEFKDLIHTYKTLNDSHIGSFMEGMSEPYLSIKISEWDFDNIQRRVKEFLKKYKCCLMRY